MIKRILFVLLCITGVVLTACSHSQRDEQLLLSTDDTTQTTMDLSESAKIEGSIFVYICGEVKKPDVYELTEGSRVVDAVKAAGGLTKQAQAEGVNQARMLTDGEQVYVPSKEEGTQTVSAGEQESNGKNRINLNTADEAALMTLPGIGSAKAKLIVGYRESHGAFKSIEEIKNIEGIKDGVFEKIKDFITIN